VLTSSAEAWLRGVHRLLRLQLRLLLRLLLRLQLRLQLRRRLRLLLRRRLRLLQLELLQLRLLRRHRPGWRHGRQVRRKQHARHVRPRHGRNAG
jgi:hypothetical protein